MRYVELFGTLSFLLASEIVKPLGLSAKSSKRLSALSTEFTRGALFRCFMYLMVKLACLFVQHYEQKFIISTKNSCPDIWFLYTELKKCFSEVAISWIAKKVRNQVISSKASEKYTRRVHG
jgi:hypothetical protein